MSGASNNSTLPLTPTTDTSSSLHSLPDYTLPFRSSHGFISPQGFSSPDRSMSQTPTRSQEKASPSVKSSESNFTRITYNKDQAGDKMQSPLTLKSDASLSGFMRPEATAVGMKPGSFMLYSKGMPSEVSPDDTEQRTEPDSGPVELSDSAEFEAMEDTGPDSIEESDRMEEEKSSCRETTPTLSSRTATVSPSHSSSFSVSRGSRSRSWTKSSSQSKRSHSRSRSHNSTTSSTTPTRTRKSRRRRHRRTPSTPSLHSRSQSRSLTPTPTPTPTRSRHSSKRKKGKSSSSESPVPRKYRNSSTDEFDQDYAAFTEVPPGNRDTDAFAYFGNPASTIKERERTPHSYSMPRTQLDRYPPSRPYNHRFPRSGYSHSHNHSHTSRGHDVHVYEHTSPRHRESFRDGYSTYNTNYPHSNRDRSNYSGNYITSPQKSYQQHRGNYNNYNHPSSHRGSYPNTYNSSYQKPNYSSSYTHQRGSFNYSQRGGYSNYYHQRESYHSKRQSDTGSSEKKDNAGFGAFYRKDEAEWEIEEVQNRRIPRDDSPSSNRTVPARLAGRLGPLPSGQYHRNESILWKGGTRVRGRPYQDRSGYKKYYNNSDEEYKLNLRIKDIIAKNEEILRRKIEVEEDKMIHGVT